MAQNCEEKVISDMQIIRKLFSVSLRFMSTYLQSVFVAVPISPLFILARFRAVLLHLIFPRKSPALVQPVFSGEQGRAYICNWEYYLP